MVVGNNTIIIIWYDLSPNPISSAGRSPTGLGRTAWQYPSLPVHSQLRSSPGNTETVRQAVRYREQFAAG